MSSAQIGSEGLMVVGCGRAFRRDGIVLLIILISLLVRVIRLDCGMIGGAVGCGRAFRWDGIVLLIILISLLVHVIGLDCGMIGDVEISHCGRFFNIGKLHLESCTSQNILYNNPHWYQTPTGN